MEIEITVGSLTQRQGWNNTIETIIINDDTHLSTSPPAQSQ
jgi:hypothetical protein